MSIKWICKHHTELNVQQLYAVLKLRAGVFVVEQQCVYLDVDGQDLTGDTCHLMAWQEDQLVAYLRLLDPIQQGGDVTIGRVVTAPSIRSKGIGHELMVQALEHAERKWPDQPVGAGAPAGLLQPLWLQSGGRGLPRRRHPAHRHASRSGVRAVGLRRLQKRRGEN